MNHSELKMASRWTLWAALSVLLLLLTVTSPAQAAAASTQATFKTPEAAVDALLTALKNSDDGALSEL
ncbi:MAG TPA: hypothetical protein VLG48_02190, partial [Candidatus Methylomirabilis sp.]|nr:hypothetical protein [Candidatus Methylomirabilis sp.]